MPIEPKGNDMADELPRFALGDLVETVKGAKFWGEIIAFDNDGKSAGCTVLAIDPGFAGTKHVYPLKQLRARLSRPSMGDPVALLQSLKRRMEHERRFGSAMPNNTSRVLTQVEGDIEEWLIDYGYQKSDEREPLAAPSHPSPQGGAGPGDVRVVAWLIERKGLDTKHGRPHWYVENEDDGWHWWTPDASQAKRFATEQEARAFLPFQMISSDPDISVTEHVFLSPTHPIGETTDAVSEAEVEAAYDAFTQSFNSKPIGTNNTRDDLRAAIVAAQRARK